MYDSLLLTEFILSHNGELDRATIIGHKRDSKGNPIGRYDPNPLLNSRIYLAEFPDGHIIKLSTNSIFEAIYDQIDDDAFDMLLFKDIIGHELDLSAMSTDEKDLIENLESTDPIVTEKGINPRYTTRGWKICIEWQDGFTSWLPLMDVKNSFPVQLAKYAV
jgi:hypothetical protein